MFPKSAVVIEFELARLKRQPVEPEGPDDDVPLYRLNICGGDIDVTVHITEDQLAEFAEKALAALAEMDGPDDAA